MGIYLMGMEMPKDGILCIDIHQNGRISGHYDCTVKDARAMAVPEHGDLIDRDALPPGRVEWEDVVTAPIVIPKEAAP